MSSTEVLVGELKGRLSGMETRTQSMEEKLNKLEEKVDTLIELMSQTRGGWKAMAFIVGIAVALGGGASALVSNILAFFK